MNQILLFHTQKPQILLLSFQMKAPVAAPTGVGDSPVNQLACSLLFVDKDNGYRLILWYSPMQMRFLAQSYHQLSLQKNSGAVCKGTEHLQGALQFKNNFFLLFSQFKKHYNSLYITSCTNSFLFYLIAFVTILSP